MHVKLLYFKYGFIRVFPLHSGESLILHDIQPSIKKYMGK